MKSRDVEIIVALREEAGVTPVGVLRFAALGHGEADGQPGSGRQTVSGVGFTYLSQYRGPALDPIHLNYHQEGAFFQSGTLPRVFQDCLPGAHGLRQLAREMPDTRNLDPALLLERIAERGHAAGALLFFTKVPGMPSPLESLREVDAVRLKSMADLAGEYVKMNEREISASIAFGGARPKAWFCDIGGELGAVCAHYLVKFNVTDTCGERTFDAFNYARVEHATLKLAQKAGVDVVRTAVVAVRKKGVHVDDLFLTERYDRYVSAQGTDGFRHRISLLSLCDEERVRSQDGGDYRDVLEAIRQVSVKPDIDVREAVRRLLFNVGINNTDDHLKNFEMVWREPDADGTPAGWRLAPAYDVLPNAHPYTHTTLLFGLPNGTLKDDFCDIVARHSGLPLTEVLAMRDEVAGALAQWEAVFKAAGCDERDLTWTARAVRQSGRQAERRLGLGAQLPEVPDVARAREAAQPYVADTTSASLLATVAARPGPGTKAALPRPG